MKIKITILITATIIILTCCKTKNRIQINNNLIERIAHEDQKFPSQFGNVLFFAKCKDNKLVQLDVHYFRELYRLSKINSDYVTFLRHVLNQTQKIDCIDVTKKFDLDKNVYTLYKKLSIENFINSYCIKYAENRYALNKGLAENQINTVLYLLFINNYIGGPDDYIGDYHVRKYMIE